MRVGLVIACILVLACLSEAKKVDLNLLMPDVSPQTKDTYLCHKVKLDRNEPVYITEFEPHASQELVHHILVFACSEVGDEDIWNCGEMNTKVDGEQQYKTGPVCRNKQSIVYAWALDAPKLTLPKDVAFKLGGDSGKNYLVIQVHYANVDKFNQGATDNSGIILKGQTEPLPNSAGVYFTATNGQIKAGETEKFETACQMNEDIVIHPFAYRTHTHKLGLVNSGYLVRNSGGEQTWTEIGRRSPQLPQMFFPVSNEVEIRKGDVIATRCTMKNFRDETVRIGATGDNEMCNFYIMYYVKGDQLMSNNMCYTMGPPFWYFKDFKDSDGNRLDLDKLPADASTIPEKQVAELEEMKKNGGGHGGHHGSVAIPSSDSMSMKEMNHMNHHEEETSDEMPSDELEEDLIELEKEVALKKLLKKLRLHN